MGLGCGGEIRVGGLVDVNQELQVLFKEQKGIKINKTIWDGRRYLNQKHSQGILKQIKIKNEKK